MAKIKIEILKWRKTFVFMLMCGILCSACDEESGNGPDPNMIYDFEPYDVTIKIVDNEGVNLLNLAEPGNWMDEPFEVEFKSKRYQTEWLKYLISYYGGEERWEIPETLEHQARAIPSTFIGLRCEEEMVWKSSRGWDWSKGCYLLKFGNFDPCEDWSISLKFIVPVIEEEIKIEVTNKFWWEKHDAQIDRHVYVNGEEVDYKPIEIVLPRLSE